MVQPKGIPMSSMIETATCETDHVMTSNRDERLSNGSHTVRKLSVCVCLVL